jgi:hypothetical protein
MKTRFLTLLKSTERGGIDDLILYLANNTDFFEAPASSNNHGAYKGGLVEHSLEVYDNLLKIVSAFNLKYDLNSLILVALLHDLCKVNFYKADTRNVQDFNPTTCNDKGWSRVPYFSIDDKMPLGHGEKSAIIAQQYIKLTIEEIMTIRWHMGGFDDAARAYGGGLALTSAMDKYPLVVALHMADIALNLKKEEVKLGQQSIQ